uniref:Uncharacterized protein n=1 Tax=Brassica oleracea var. oleracea TaxID=109376 RepID=A0A0D3B9U5_BRAOL
MEGSEYIPIFQSATNVAGVLAAVEPPEKGRRRRSLQPGSGEEPGGLKSKVRYCPTVSPRKGKILKKGGEKVSGFCQKGVKPGRKATGNVLGMWLSTGKAIHISKSAFQGMNNLQFLSFAPNTLRTPDGLYCLPGKLILLHWDDCPLRFWPSKFSGKFLVELFMPHSELEMLWEGTKPLPCLKVLDLSSSGNLKILPDLSKATSLEELSLMNCKNLLELTIYSPSQFRFLNDQFDKKTTSTFILQIQSLYLVVKCI